MQMLMFAAAEQADDVNLPDWIAAGAAALALIVSVVAAVYAAKAAKAAEANVQAAERSATAAELSAATAKDSAYASGLSANSSAELLRVELNRVHDEYAPVRNGKWVFEPRSTSTHVRVLTYVFKVDREYQVLATAAGMNGSPTTVCNVAAGDEPGVLRVHVEDWSPDREYSEWRELTLRFWPPQGREGRARPWNCLCGRQLDQGEGDAAAHWDFTVPVAPPDERAPRVAFV